jgi:hypothetical protein
LSSGSACDAPDPPPAPAPPTPGGDGAAVRRVWPRSGASQAEPELNVLDQFEAGGRTWRLTYVSRPQLCVELRSGDESAGSACWAGAPLEGRALDAAGTTYLVAFTAESVREVSHGPVRPDDLVPARGSGASGRVYAKVMPPDLASVELVAATAADPRAYTRTVTLHGRVSVVNGELAAPATPTTTVTTRPVPPAPPTTADPGTPVSTVPPTVPTTVAAPPPGGNPQRVEVVPGVGQMAKRPFESASAAGAQSVAVRWWDGIAPCSVLARVDVVEAADRVTITIWTGAAPGAENTACTMQAVYKETIVALSAPLAGRTIVDGAA